METEYTQRLEAVADDLRKSIQKLSVYTAADLEKRMMTLSRTWNTSSVASNSAELFRAFDALGISYEMGQSLSYYEELVKESIRNGKAPRKVPALDNQLLQILYQYYMEYRIPTDYIQRTVDRLASDPWENDSLRLRILKQFIKYGDYLSAAGFGGKTAIPNYVRGKMGARQGRLTEADILEVLDDGVFDVLKDANEDQLKPRGRYGLLKMVDDLADGKFRSGGATRKSLYLFAMVYGMTYCPDREHIDEKTDVEKNLFKDYYTNNVMRFITETYQENPAAYETPSDQGINVKNFAEIVYLYYISQDCTPQEKIRRSSEMIDRLRQAAPDTQEKPEATLENTRRYRELIGPNSRVWTLSEDLFEEFIRTNPYPRNTRAGNALVGPLQLETEQNTAYQKYTEILKELGDLSQYNYGLFCADAAVLEKFEESNREYLGADLKDFKQFKRLLIAVNSYLGHTVFEEPSDATYDQEWKEASTAVITALAVDSPKKMSRTAFITAYYYYFNKRNEGSSWDISGFWEAFTEEINSELVEAGYYPMNSKNILDVLTVISSYIYLTT